VFRDPQLIGSRPGTISVADMDREKRHTHGGRCARPVIHDHEVGIHTIAASAKRVFRTLPGKCSEKIVTFGADANIHRE